MLIAKEACVAHIYIYGLLRQHPHRTCKSRYWRRANEPTCIRGIEFHRLHIRTYNTHRDMHVSQKRAERAEKERKDRTRDVQWLYRRIYKGDESSVALAIKERERGKHNAADADAIVLYTSYASGPVIHCLVTSLFCYYPLASLLSRSPDA